MKLDEDTLRHVEVIGTFVVCFAIAVGILIALGWCGRWPLCCYVDPPATGTIGLRASAVLADLEGWV